MEHVTEESIKKIQEIIDKRPYISSYGFEEDVTNEMLGILRNDEKFQEYSKQMMNKIILGDNP